MSAGGEPVDQPARGEHISQAGEQRSSRVESLRALAALSVVFGHVLGITVALDLAGAGGSAPASVFDRLVYGGGFGVYFFFVLTGYLLFWPFARRHWGGHDAIDLRRYGVNRALRILPLYFAVIIILLLVQEHGGTLHQWTRFMTFTQTLSSRTAETVDGPAWSLVVEIYFYILLPFIAAGIALASGASRRRAAAVLVAIAAVAIAVRYRTYITPQHPSVVWRFSLPTNFFFFLPGMLLALLRLSWEERRPSWLRGPLERADVWVLASLAPWLVVVLKRYDLDPLIGLAGFMMVGACVLPLRPGPLVNALQWRPLAIVGVASYSLYLWHVPILHALTKTSWAPTGFWGLAAVAVPLSIAVALVSYRLIESPFLGLRRQWARSAAPHDPTPVPLPEVTPTAEATGNG